MLTAQVLADAEALRHRAVEVLAPPATVFCAILMVCVVIYSLRLRGLLRLSEAEKKTDVATRIGKSVGAAALAVYFSAVGAFGLWLAAFYVYRRWQAVLSTLISGS